GLRPHEPVSDTRHRLVQDDPPPGGVYAVARGHRTIFGCPHKPTMINAVAVFMPAPRPTLKPSDVGVLARSVLEVVRYEDAPAQAAETMDANFRVLFRELRRLQRRALREATTEKTSAKIKRLKRSFLLDHPTWASREAALLLLDDIETGLDNSIDAEDLRSQIRSVRRDFTLDDEPTEPIPDFPGFRSALDKLVYREINEVQEA
ncbi:hypothetical protein KBX06_26925, partial [Micromonospora sp. C31]|uniref:hypothetical protein n=1 Tax=Micromonospora sp. C31 TaxID=2824876 RepID=UPI001B35F67E